MPDTDLAKAYLIGERLRQCIAAAPFYAGERVRTLRVTAAWALRRSKQWATLRHAS
jgi:PleD family two-component response regulator